MKHIIIIRHAKSSWTDINLSDFERTLDPRGLSDAPIMAERLKSKGYSPEIIVSSDAMRAKTTAAYFADCFGLSLKLDPKLYHGQSDNYLNAIAGINDEINTVALVGHNPGITHIANLIAPGCTNNIPTCGIIIATSSKTHWSFMSWKDMHVETLMFPKDSNND
ncbi:MAG: histidine phosphatase family protein [Saprospiraceae bacterium]|nr:histidine phosphatase family protein [Saprospiraceae bacterium]